MLSLERPVALKEKGLLFLFSQVSDYLFIRVSPDTIHHDFMRLFLLKFFFFFCYFGCIGS